MTISVPTVTGYSAFWQNVSNINGEVGVPYRMLFSRSSHERRASNALYRSGFRAVRELLETVTGAAAGGTAADSYVRAGTTGQGPTAIGPGGARDMETVTTVNRATTAGDITTLLARISVGIFAQAPAIPSGYVADASGNGGGGKVRF